MNRLKLMAALASLGFGTSPYGTAKKSIRVPYPYAMGHHHDRAGRGPQHCKKGPGRRHRQGKTHNRYRRLHTGLWG